MFRNRFSVTNRNTRFSAAARRLGHYLGHRRIVLFWAVAGLSMVAPWGLKGCQLPSLPVATTTEYANCAVRSIYDGDTMTLLCAGRKMKVRLYCIDAPEMAQKPWGRKSRDHLRSITPPSVNLISRGKDHYGRVIGELFADGLNLNLQQVGGGWAAEYERYCGDPKYREAQLSASDKNKGIWFASGVHQMPWLFRNSKK